MKKPFHPFGPVLKKLGFKKTWHTQAGGEKMTEYERTEEQGWFKRVLVVQVYAGGGHRVSHTIFDKPNCGAMTTTPTYFTDEASLREAVRHETTRMDNKKLTGET